MNFILCLINIILFKQLTNLIKFHKQKKNKKFNTFTKFYTLIPLEF